MNEILLFIEIIVVFSLLLLTKKFFGKNGLFIWIAIATVTAEIQVVKSINIFGLSGTLGNVMFASNFLATDILNELYSREDAKKGVYVGLWAVIIFIIFTQFMLLFKPNEIDMANDSMKVLFGLVPRVSISSITMFFIANMADVYIYSKFKEKFKEKKMWLRNNISTILCNSVENFFFVFFAFVGFYSFKDIMIIALSTTLIEVIIAICDTPFLYLSKLKMFTCKEEL